VYRVEQRHRTRIIANAYIMFSDLRRFTKLTETEPVTTVERVLDNLTSLVRDVARQFGGTIQYSVGDSLCVTFSVASQAIAAAERLYRDWGTVMHEQGLGCAINIALHRGTICIFKSFLYGEGVNIAWAVQEASAAVLEPGDGDVFVTGTVRDGLAGSAWHDRLEPMALPPQHARFANLGIYRLNGRSAAVRCERDQDGLGGDPASAGGLAPAPMTGPLPTPRT
jgi:class 3 adenylate cyclase